MPSPLYTKKYLFWLIAIYLAALGTYCFAKDSPAQLDYQLVKVLDHQQNIFTQGMVIDGDTVTESSGLYGRSFLIQYNKNTGEASSKKRLPKNLFAEGIAINDDRLCMLTWKAGQLMCFDRHSLKPLSDTRYTGQGWGLTTLENQWLMSDGSHRLFFRDSNSFEITRTLKVSLNGKPLSRLNDLSTNGDVIFANQWQTPYVWIIAPDNGSLVGYLDLSNLAGKNQKNSEQVLNGLAWDKHLNGLWVTGKHWKHRYLLKIPKLIE